MVELIDGAALQSVTSTGPSALSLTRPLSQCECSFAPDPHKISSQFNSFLTFDEVLEPPSPILNTPTKFNLTTISDHETGSQSPVTDQVDICDTLSNWTVYRIECSGYNFNADRSSMANSPHDPHDLIIEASNCTTASHYIKIVSNFHVCSVDPNSCQDDTHPSFRSFPLSHQMQNDAIEGNAFRPVDHGGPDISLSPTGSTRPILLDLGLLIKFVKERADSVGTSEGMEGVPKCRSLLWVFVQIFRELEYPLAEPCGGFEMLSTIPPSTKVARHSILSFIRDFERERTLRSLQALEKANKERITRMWSVLMLRLKIENLKEYLNPTLTTCLSTSACRQVDRLTLHPDQNLLEECHYIQ